MRKIKFTLFVLCMLFSSIAHAYDYDFYACNDDGVKLYYDFLADGSVGLTTIESSEYSGVVNIPSSVTYDSVEYPVTIIGSFTFYNCTGLTSITIPKSVTQIAYDAFLGCTGLTSIVVEDGNSVYDSRDNCNAIIKTNTNTLLIGCNNTTIPNSVNSINNDAFNYCPGLTSITIPKSVSSISGYTFMGCKGLTSIVVEDGHSIYDSRNNCNAIIETNTNTLIRGCENTIIPNSVTTIGGSAFYCCEGLTTITIPNSVTRIDVGAFSGCHKLTNITIPNSVTSIGSIAFANCI